MKEITYPIRLNKYLAYKGLCSRREADSLIEKKKVYVNGAVASLGYMVQEQDKVELHRGHKKEHIYLAYHKPRGVVTHSPQNEEVDIAHSLGRDDVFPVGRLDKDSEGLILLTNDGRIVEKLLSPESCHEKEYVVTVDKPITQSALKRLSEGVVIENYMTKAAVVKRLGATQISIVLTEGKKHQIRRMLAALGYTTRRLKRVRIGNIKLEGLPQNETSALEGRTLQDFKKDLGLG